MKKISIEHISAEGFQVIEEKDNGDKGRVVDGNWVDILVIVIHFLLEKFLPKGE